MQISCTIQATKSPKYLRMINEDETFSAMIRSGGELSAGDTVTVTLKKS